MKKQEILLASQITSFMPIGLLLVVDEANGGDVTAQELIRRFHLLNQESGNLIDFYFMGWHWIAQGDRSKGIRFNLSTFGECRAALKKAGVKTFGGNADLILVDAYYWWPKKGYPTDVPPLRYGRIDLDFRNAIHIDLSGRAKEADIPPVGQLLQAIINVAEEVRAANGRFSDGSVFAISDKLGIATAKRSLLTFILDKFGAIIGARKLESLTVRDLGPVVELNDLVLPSVVPQAGASSS